MSVSTYVGVSPILTYVGVSPILTYVGVSPIFACVTCVLPVPQLRSAIEKDLKEAGLQLHPSTILKIIQLYETKNSRYWCLCNSRTTKCSLATKYTQLK